MHAPFPSPCLRIVTLALACGWCLGAPLQEPKSGASGGQDAPAALESQNPASEEAAGDRSANLVRLQLLQSPRFQPARGAGARVPLPWWLSSRGHALVDPEGGLRLEPGDWVEQALAFPAEQAEQLGLRLRLVGKGKVLLRDGAGRRGEWSLGSAEEETTLLLSPAALKAGLGAAPTPRLVVRLEAEPGSSARWLEAGCDLDMSAPSTEELWDDISAEVAWVLELYREHGSDQVGPKKTAFVANFFDVLTGKALWPLPGQHSAVADLYLAAARLGIPGGERANSAFVADLLSLGFDPGTGLPWRYDCVQDKPRGMSPVEPHACLGYLVDLAEKGAPGLDPKLQAAARDAARKLGTALLLHGPLPDGQMCAMYVPSTGAPATNYPALRRLDVPAQVARTAAFEGLKEPPVAVVDAVAKLLYTHAWVGDWREIDPGFDDNYGHYGGRGVVLWRAFPQVGMFRELAMSGWRYYAPRWRDTLRFGGNVAADQVRCWGIFAEASELEPSLVEPLARLLCDALYVHWKGEQYDGGAWGDVTIKDFNPKGHLQVGDTKGVPQNMLAGMAVLYDRRFAAVPAGKGLPAGMSLPELRARIAAVLSSTRTQYRRPFGYLSTRAEVEGDNTCGGELRLAVSLVAILEAMGQAHPELLER